MKTLKSLLQLPHSGVSLGQLTPWLKMLVLLLNAIAIVSAIGMTNEDHLQVGGNGGDNDQFAHFSQNIKMQDLRICPKAEDIYPCQCYYIGVTFPYELGISCTYVTSEDQLKQVFLAHFPHQSFNYFSMKYNGNLKVLESNVFGNVSFEEIHIYLSHIEIIETGAFSSSYETVRKIDLSYNKITTFPFQDLKKFSILNEFSIQENDLEPLPLDSFHGLTSLESIYLKGNRGSFTGTFQNIPNLKNLHFGSTNLSTIPPNLFKTESSDLEIIFVPSCQIESVEPDTFTIVRGLHIGLDDNLLTTLNEETWRPMMEGGVFIYVNSNPLDCGCDLAWLYREDHLLDHVWPEATCRDGQNLYDLDPQIFDQC